MHAENGLVINELAERARRLVKQRPNITLTRPAESEAEGVNRAIEISKMANSPVYGSCT